MYRKCKENVKKMLRKFQIKVRKQFRKAAGFQFGLVYGEGNSVSSAEIGGQVLAEKSPEKRDFAKCLSFGYFAKRGTKCINEAIRCKS